MNRVARIIQGQFYVQISSYTDAELLELMFPEQGEPDRREEAWEEFFRRADTYTMKALRHLAPRYRKRYQFTNEDLEDLSQYVMINLSRNEYRVLRNLREKCQGSVQQYLYATANNILLSHLRAMNRDCRSGITNSLDDMSHFSNGEGSFDELSELIDGEDPEYLYLEKEFFERVWDSVEEESEEDLKKRNRAIFKLAFEEGYSYSELADREDIELSRSGIASLFSKILPKLKSRLANFYKKETPTEKTKK